jgi:hypothetical protein
MTAGQIDDDFDQSGVGADGLIHGYTKSRVTGRESRRVQTKEPGYVLRHMGAAPDEERHHEDMAGCGPLEQRLERRVVVEETS